MIGGEHGHGDRRYLAELNDREHPDAGFAAKEPLAAGAHIWPTRVGPAASPVDQLEIRDSRMETIGATGAKQPEPRPFE